MNRTLLILCFSMSWGIIINSYSQYLPVHPSSPVYEFLTELSNDGIIRTSSFSSPFGRNEIADLLEEADGGKLNSRQIKTLDFYKKDFGKLSGNFRSGVKRADLLYYRDSLFMLRVNPILGGDYLVNENGSAWHWWNGAEAVSSIGKWGFWGSLRDNHESEYLTRKDFLNQNYGGANQKVFENGQVDYWETRGGISYDFGIGHIAIMKDHFSWGSNYHGSNILSGRAPSFPHISFEIRPVKWFEFRYIHAWLSSEVVDSSRSFFVSNAYGTDYREVYHSKFMAANLFTFRPVGWADISFGNSIIYDYDNPHLAYFIPVMFYKAMDHHLNSGIDNMNSQMFLDLSMRPFRHIHLYSTLFLDELAVKRITDPDDYNLYSFKSGIRFSNVLPGIYGGLEWTITNALTFRHYVNTTTFESNSYNLGHYLEDNAKEIFIYFGWKPVRNMDLKISYCGIEKGPDHTLLGTMPRNKVSPFTPVIWESDEAAFQFRFELMHDLSLRVNYSHSFIRGEADRLEEWTPEFNRGKTNTIGIGLNFGF